VQSLAPGGTRLAATSRAAAALRRVVSARHFGPLALVAAVVVAANLLFLLGVFDPNPLYFASGLGIIHAGGVLPGSSTIDPNSGTTAQSLGHLAMLDILHGHLPWWNPYEGIGAPLAGEMQSAAFFPPNLLLAIFGGQLFLHILLEASAGAATYGLLVRLDVSRWIAGGAGCAFALDGAFSWFGHAPVNPIALLPLLLFAVEWARAAAVEGRPGRWILIAIALALSVYAGFPEVTYLDSILAAVWILVRCVGLHRAQVLAYVRKVAMGGVVGVLLATPILVAFADYLPNAYLGSHGTGFNSIALIHPSSAALFFPYVFGPIFGYTLKDPDGLLPLFWGSVGGYLTTTLLLFDLVALYARRLRPLRIALLAWMVVALGRTYGVGPLQRLFDYLPLMEKVAAYRYLPPSIALASVVLAGLGIDDIRRREVPRWGVLAALGAAGAGAVALLLPGRSIEHQIGSGGGAHSFLVGSVLWGFGIIVVATALAVLLRGRLRTGLLVGLLVADALAMFVVPEFSAPRSARVDTRLVNVVRAHTGLGRFYTFGPYTPNYGSFFHTGEVDVNDLPLPKRYASYITSDLDTNVLPNIFIGFTTVSPVKPTPLEQLVKHLAAYERIDVRVIVSAPKFIPEKTAKVMGLRRIYSDYVADVYLTPHPSSFYSAVPPRASRAGGAPASCSLSHETLVGVVADCRRPAVLVRRELTMKGWSATVGGHSVSVGARDGLFQQVALPAGRSVVTFSFKPPHEEAGGVAFVGGILCVLGGWILAGRATRRRQPWSSSGHREAARTADESAPDEVPASVPLSAR
jgi:hypothetical protein